MIVSENEEAIYKQLNKNRLKLYATLSKKINIDTDNYFYVNDGINLYYPDLENLNEFIFWDPNPQKPCPCPQFRNEGDGVVSFLGAVFKTGWENAEQWEMVADIKFGNLYKTGLILLTDANNPFPKNGWGSEHSGRWGISAWERFIGTPYTLDGNPHYEITYEGNSERFTSYSSSWANNVWHSLHMKKVSSTRLIVWLDDNENDRIIYDWEELSDVEQVTFGATMNHNTSDYGICGGSFPLIRLYVRDLYVFYPALPTNRLTALCEDTKKIKCSTNNSATIPPTPNLVNGNTLAINEFNIHNKIQYCNNVLRYTLRKCGIDFTNESNELSNKMNELIKFINQIMTTPTINIDEAYSAYVNPIQLLGDKSIVQANETYNLIAEVVDGGAGIEVNFIQKNQPFSYEWYNASDYISITEDATGITFANNTSENRWIWINKTLTSTSDFYDFKCPFVLEFDIVSRTGTNTIVYANTSATTSIYKNFNQLNITGNNHIKIVGKEESIDFYVDSALKSSMSKDNGKVRLGFRINPNESFKFNNLKLTYDDVVPNVLKSYEDNGTIVSHNDENWETWSNYPVTVTRKSDYTSIEQSTSGTTGFHIFNFSSLEPQIIEFDFLKKDGLVNEIIFQLRNSSRGVLRQVALSTWGNTELDKWHHIKLDFKNKLIYFDGVDIAMNDIAPSHLYLSCYATTTETRYKNFRVYTENPVDTTITDANGIATINIYGDGSGLEQYSAKCENIESEPITVIDGIFYDKGTTGTGHYYNPNSVSNVASSDGRTFTNSDSSARYVQVVPSNQALANQLFYTPPFVVELDLVAHSGTCYVAIGDGSNNHYWNFANISDSEHHLKYVITSTSQNLYLDNSDTPSRTTNYNLGDCRIQLVLGSGGSMKYKNFVVYPIESEEL